MNPNIARNCKSFHFRKATAHDAVVIERGENHSGPFLVMEKVNHPILVLHRDFEYPEPSRRDKGGNMILPPLPEMTQDHIDYFAYKFRGTARMYNRCNGYVLRDREFSHKQRMLRDKAAAILRRQGILSVKPLTLQ